MSAGAPLDSAQLSGFVAQLGRDGVTLWVQDGQLKFRAPRGGLTPELRDRLVGNKEALIRHLDAAPAAPQPAGREHPLSHMQQRLWFLKQLQPGLAAYNMPIGVRLRGRLEVAALQAALDEVVQRHESLRTHVVAEDGVPRCVVEPRVRVEVQTRDVSGGDDPEARGREAVAELANRPFGPADHPLVRALLVRLGEDDHILCIVVDHLVGDGRSLMILMGELFSTYERQRTGKGSPLPPLTQQYADFIEWQKQRDDEGASERVLQYWRGKLAGAAPFLQLPADKPRPPVQTNTGAHVSMMRPQELVSRLRGLARAEGATMFMVLMTAFQSLLQRLSGQSDIPVGTAVANRGDGRFDQVIGFFANNLVIRGDLTGNPAMRELLARTRQVALEAYAHEELQFDRLVEALAPARGLDRSPIFQVMFVLRSERGIVDEFAGLKFEPLDSGQLTSRVDLAVDAVEQNDGIQLVFEYNTDLFLPQTITAFIGRYLRILESMAADPGARLGDLPVLDGDELQALRRFEAGPQVDVPGSSFISAFAARCREHAGTVAIGCQQRSLTYGQLDSAANRVAHALRGMGVGRGSKVALCMERTGQLLVALLGIQKSGAAYVPLDPGFPAERLQYMLEDSGAGVLVTAAGAADHIQVPQQVRVLDVVKQAQDLASQPDTDPAPQIAPEDAAYVIYTSGSTGRPKGVAVSHGALLNFLHSMAREPGLGKHDVLAAVTTISFDIAGLELYLPLLVGARIELVSRQEAIDGQALSARLASSSATVLQATPATWRLLIETGWRGAPGFRAFCGGEALPQQLADDLLERVGELWNLYGPTETTIWSTLEQVRKGQRITVGRPIANTQVYVLGAAMERMPVGSPGEIWIGGDGVALGYHERPELTAERFVPDPFSTVPGARLYRTGDLGRWGRDGRLEHLGRADGQVKIRGYRIELGEIEAVMERCEGVRQAAVVVLKPGTGDERLTGCVVLDDPQQAVPEALPTQLREALPEYMVPRQIIALESLPLTANGKVDRKTLAGSAALAPAPVVSRSNETFSPTQQRVAALWREVLQVGHVGLHDDFFDSGGHSLLLVRLQVYVKREFDVEASVADLLANTTVAALAELIESRGSAQARASTPAQEMPQAVVLMKPAAAADGIPVFGIPGHNGDVLCYRQFCQMLDIPGAFYALQPPGVDGHEVPLEDVHQLAAHSLKQIDSVYPAGPCIVMGYCVGGSVALEVARGLEAQGRLRSITIIAGVHPRHYSLMGKIGMEFRWVRFLIRRKWNSLTSGGWRGLARFIGARPAATENRPPAPQAIPDRELAAQRATRRRMEKATLRAIAAYRPGAPLEAPVAVLVPPTLWHLYSDEEVMAGWQAVGHNVQGLTCDINDDGGKMLVPPQVDVVAGEFRKFIQATGGGTIAGS